MQVTELYELIRWVDEEIVLKKITSAYGALHSILHNNTQANQAKKPFSDEKDALVGTLQSVRLASLSRSQLQYLEKLEILPHVGTAAAEVVDDIVFRNNLDSSTAAAKIQEMITQINRGITKSNTIKEGIAGLVGFEEATSEPYIVSATFDGDAKISDVTELKKWSNAWYEIGRGLTLAHGQAPEDFRVISASNGSIKIEFAVSIDVAKLTNDIIRGLMAVTNRIQKLRVEERRIREMDITLDARKTMLKIIKDEIESVRDTGVSQITEESKPKTNVSENEDLSIPYDKAIERLSEFLNKDGDVEVICSVDPDIDDDDLSPVDQALRDEIEEVRKLKAVTLKLSVSSGEHHEQAQDDDE